MSLVKKILNKQRYKQDQPTKSSLVLTKQYGSVITPDTSLQVSAFFRGVTYIASQLAKLPFNIKDINDNNLPKSNEIYRLLNRNPNEDMSAFNWKFWAVVNCCVQGNAFSEIVRNTLGQIVAIVPISKHDICMVRDRNNKLFYQMSNTLTGDVVFLRKDEVLHWRNLHTEDGINGMSFINYASKTLGVASGAEKMAGALYENSGLPSGTLQTDRTLSEEAIERLKTDWKNKFGGNKAGGVSVLEEGLSFNPINMSPDILQFLESRHFSVIELARFLGVPPSKMYVIEAQAYNNIESSNLEVANDTIDPWCSNLEGEVNMKVLDEDQHSDMDIFEISRGDMKTRGEFYGKMISNGAMTPNEAREKERMPKYDGGDEHYIGTNNLTPISRHDEIIDSQIKGKEKQDNAESELKTALAKKMSKR